MAVGVSNLEKFMRAKMLFDAFGCVSSFSKSKRLVHNT